MIGGLIFLGVLLLIFLTIILPGIFTVGANEVGILIKKMTGDKLSEGQIIARNGENGIQAQTLMPGLYWKFWITWDWIKVPVTIISPEKIGIVESIDGIPLPSHRLLGDQVESNSFQDTKKFLDNKGHRGLQIEFLRPGTYRINTRAFNISEHNAVFIDSNKVGIIIADDGKALPNGYVIAPEPDGSKDHRFFQDGQAFIDAGGYRGPQLKVLQPGQYYINTALFGIKIIDIAEVPPGYVAVIRSNVGVELEKSEGAPSKSSGEGQLSGSVHDKAESLLTTDKNTRGIWREAVAPGKYPLNMFAFTPYLVPTSAVTIDWASEGKIGTDVKGVLRINTPQGDADSVLYKFNPLKVTSQDGFQLEVNVRMIIRIQPANAAYIIARFGSVMNLIDQIVHPLIDSSFRNKAGEKKAIDFFQSRTTLQTDALNHAKDKFAEYNVEAQNLLIAYIDIPDNLLETQTKKEIALQQQEQYVQEAKAQDSRIAVQEKSARADKQKDVIAATLEIGIKTDLAKARTAEAEGEATFRQKTSAAEGLGLAEGLKAQKEALGESNTAVVTIMKYLADHNIPIVPQTLITSGGNGGGGLLDSFMGMLTAQKAKEFIPAKQVTEEKK